MSNNALGFLSAVPVLPALALKDAIAFYEQRLGFTTEFKYDDYAGLSQDEIQIHLEKKELSFRVCTLDENYPPNS